MWYFSIKITTTKEYFKPWTIHAQHFLNYFFCIDCSLCIRNYLNVDSKCPMCGVVSTTFYVEWYYLITVGNCLILVDKMWMLIVDISWLYIVCSREPTKEQQNHRWNCEKFYKNKVCRTAVFTLYEWILFQNSVYLIMYRNDLLQLLKSSSSKDTTRVEEKSKTFGNEVSSYSIKSF